jgi:hypothetical protein
MTEQQKIIQFIDDHLANNELDGLSAAEASRLLDEAGLLVDDPSKPGEPLRRLLREGSLPHAHKVQGKWFIPRSDRPMAETVAAPSGKEGLSRMKILLRLLYSILFLLVFEVLRLIVQVTVLGQYVYLLIMGVPSLPLKKFGARVSDYAYRVLRYLTLNENEKPYPFSKFPDPVSPPETEVSFD